MSRFLFILLSISVLLGCPAQDREVNPSSPAASASPPKLDLTTPDRALKSYWAQKDWYEQLITEAGKEFEKTLRPKPREVYGAVTTSDALAYWTDSRPYSNPKLQRDIDTVKQETESRAVALVRIKNVTPIPEGAQPSPRDEKRRTEGVLFRYVMEKEGSTWKVAEIWKNEEITGWRKISEKSPPLYPSDVYVD